MHIVHVVESFGGGVIGFVGQLCQYLPQHTHTVLHAIRPSEVDPAITQARFPDYVQFVHWPHAGREINPVADAKALQALVRILPTLKPDLVHLHSSKAGFLGRMACRWLGIKSVVYTPGGAALLRRDISGLQRTVYGALEVVGHAFGGQVVACGPSEAEALGRYGVSSLIIANGTDPGLEPAPRAQSDTVTVLALGRATAQKDPARFGRIAAHFEGDSRFRFIWVGAGELEADLPRRAVEVSGWIPPEEVARYLAEADVYLSTSVWEGLSLAVLEAMAAGMPLVLSDCSGNRDVVQPGQNGFLFNTEEEAISALQTLAQDHTLRAKMGKASRLLLLQEHDVRQVAKKYETLYKKLTIDN